jgi:hypothetical protein
VCHTEYLGYFCFLVFFFFLLCIVPCIERVQYLMNRKTVPNVLFYYLLVIITIIPSSNEARHSVKSVYIYKSESMFVAVFVSIFVCMYTIWGIN